MKKEKLEQIKRMIYLEEKINDLISQYPSIRKFPNSKKLLFLTQEIITIEILSIDDWEYFNVACIIPLNELQQDLEKYDNSSPKMDELKFVEDLMKKYNVSKEIIKFRIRQVRKINKFLKQEFSVLAVPCKRAFVVAPDKTEEFLNVKTNPEIRRQQKEMYERIRRNILVEDEPKVKKLGQKTDKK